jgi:hypothetical protein
MYILYNLIHLVSNIQNYKIMYLIAFELNHITTEYESIKYSRL